jgi:ATP-binding cassette subfamily F protein 3
MGFEQADFEKPVAVLSGGEKTRLALAKLLLEEPDVLVLDEPTNHLAIDACQWLEGWIRNYRGTVLMVSHDRAFLEATATKIFRLEAGAILSYPGPFTKYLELHAANEARRAEESKRQAQEIAKLDEFVRRFMNSQRTAQARGRQKQMFKLIESRIEAPTKERGMAAGFGKTARSGNIVLQTKKLQVGYQNNTLIKSLDWTVMYQERWGVVGSNGAGKSTLIKTCLGEIPCVSGEARFGSSTEIGYFTQDSEDFDHDKSPLEVLTNEDGLNPPDARKLLGRFLLSGDDVYRPIGTLSGGERNKLSLARLTHLKPNVLVLDEPTNHLDMDSRDALAQLLKEFSGTLILVSHDRWLLNQVTDHTLDVRNGKTVAYPGNYSEYEAHSTKTALPSKGPQANSGGESALSPSLTPRELSKAIQAAQREAEQAENAVSVAEEQLAELEKQLAAPAEGADITTLSIAHHAQTKSIQVLMDAWAETMEQLSRLESQRG